MWRYLNDFGSAVYLYQSTFHYTEWTDMDRQWWSLLIFGCCMRWCFLIQGRHFGGKGGHFPCALKKYLLLNI